MLVQLERHIYLPVDLLMLPRNFERAALQVNKLPISRHIEKTKIIYRWSKGYLKQSQQFKAINSFSFSEKTRPKSTMETGFALIQVELPSGIKFKQSENNQLEEERNKRGPEEVDSSSTWARPSRRSSRHSLEKWRAGGKQRNYESERRGGSNARDDFHAALFPARWYRSRDNRSKLDQMHRLPK